MIDKRTELKDVIACVKDGDTIGLGGAELERKPFAAVRELARSGRRDLTIISRGGLEVDLLIGVGVAKKVIYPSVGVPGWGVPGNFVRARTENSLHLREITESMYVLGWKAAAQGIPSSPPALPWAPISSL